MAKPPIGPAQSPPQQVHQIIIELSLDDGTLRVQHKTKDIIQALGMIELARADLISRATVVEEKKIIIPNLRIKGKIEA